jgi:hypothetical protein
LGSDGAVEGADLKFTATVVAKNAPRAVDAF